MSEPPRRTGEASAAAGDALQPFKEALRERFPSREALLAEGRAQTLRQQQRQSRNKRLAASGLALALLAAVVVADPAWHVAELRTAVGERLVVNLADGSRVTLNTGTVLRVEQRLRSRRFELAGGQAFFSVAHGPRPFIVRSGEVAVRDIGTAFDVHRLDAEQLRVGVTEGSVEITRPGSAPRIARAGELVQAGNGRIDTPQPVTLARVEAWQRGKLMFDGTPLREALAEIQRYRKAPITLEDAAAGGLRLSGEYDIAGMERLLDTLPQVLPVRVSRAADGAISVASRTR